MCAGPQSFFSFISLVGSWAFWLMDYKKIECIWNFWCQHYYKYCFLHQTITLKPPLDFSFIFIHFFSFHCGWFSLKLQVVMCAMNSGGFRFKVSKDEILHFKLASNVWCKFCVSIYQNTIYVHLKSIFYCFVFAYQFL